MGATSGIGEGIAHRLAEQGWQVIAVGRHREGRAEQIVETLNQLSPPVSSSDGADSPPPQHSFVACDCFSLKSVKTCANEILEKHSTIDALAMTQGMATTQGFTPTIDGNDEKLTLHYFSRMAFASLLLPAIQKSTLMPGGPVVMSVLSGGVHNPYTQYKEDFSLANKKNYSIKNVADAAGFYNDLGLDALAHANPKVNFVHAAPGFVNTNWGSEFNPILRTMVRCMQPLGKKASDCAEFMVGPTVLASAYDDPLPPKSSEHGVIVMGENGQPVPLTSAHSKDAIDTAWKRTIDVLKKAGLEIQ